MDGQLYIFKNYHHYFIYCNRRLPITMNTLKYMAGPAGRPARPCHSVTLHWLGYLHRSWRAETTGIDVSQRGHRYMAQPETTSCHAPVTLSGGGRMRVGLCPSTLILPTCGCTSPLRRLTCRCYMSFKGIENRKSSIWIQCAIYRVLRTSPIDSSRNIRWGFLLKSSKTTKYCDFKYDICMIILCDTY